MDVNNEAREGGDQRNIMGLEKKQVATSTGQIIRASTHHENDSAPLEKGASETFVNDPLRAIYALVSVHYSLLKRTYEHPKQRGYHPIERLRPLNTLHVLT